MNLTALIAIAFWSGMHGVDHPAPADLGNGCRVTFMAYRDRTESRSMHHLATVTCGESREEFDVRQDGNRLDIRPVSP